MPRIVDLSHSLGRKNIMLLVSKAVLAMDIDGWRFILILKIL